MDKVIFKNKNHVLAFVYLEIALLLIIVWQLYRFLGLSIVSGELLFFQNEISVNEAYFLLVNIAVFMLLYVRISLKDKNVLKIHEDFSTVVFGKAKEKVLGVEKKIIIVFLFQVIFAIIIAISIAFYLDPEIQFPGFSEVAFPMNIIAFIAFLVFGFYVFAKTKPFREEVYDSGFLQKKLMPAQRLFPVKRITNKKTGSIRVKRKK